MLWMVLCEMYLLTMSSSCSLLSPVSQLDLIPIHPWFRPHFPLQSLMSQTRQQFSIVSLAACSCVSLTCPCSLHPEPNIALFKTSSVAFLPSLPLWLLPSHQPISRQPSKIHGLHPLLNSKILSSVLYVLSFRLYSNQTSSGQSHHLTTLSKIQYII